MNLGELRAEVKARGFDYISDARINLWINQAVRRINDLESWPWQESSSSAPTNVKAIQSVVDVSQGYLPLEYQDRRDLVATYGDLSTPGAPRFYWLLNGVVKPFPVGGSLLVEYMANQPDLTADADVPSIPAAYHDVIVDEACRRAYKDSDAWEAANALAADIAVSVDGMRNALLDQQDSGVDRVRLVGDWL